MGYREKTQGAYIGAKVEAYQKVYDGNGNLLESRTIYSTYKARPAIYVVGPTEAPVTEDPPVTDPSTGTTPDTPPEETIPDDPPGRRRGDPLAVSPGRFPTIPEHKRPRRRIEAFCGGLSFARKGKTS